MTGEVVKLARAALATSPIHVLRTLTIQQEGQSLILSGQVDSFYHKQLAQELIRLIACDLQVINAVEVDDQRRPRGGDSGLDE